MPPFEVENITVEIEVKQGRDLIAKDRNLFGKRTTSDPYLVVNVGETELGRTKVAQKTLSPVWEEKFEKVYSYKEANTLLRDSRRKIHVELNILDHDHLTKDDRMGSVFIHVDPLNPPGLKWYSVTTGVGKNQCHNARGELQIGVNVIARKILTLIRGNQHPVKHERIDVGLSWDVDNGREVDLDVSCVAVDINGNVLIDDETVYYGNLSNSNRSVVHSGGDGDPVHEDQEVISCHLRKLPRNVLALYFILTVASPGKFFTEVRSTRFRVSTTKPHQAVCSFFPSKVGRKTALFLARLARDPRQSGLWVLSPIDVADSTARDFGSLIPQIKSYTGDILPHIQVDPHERIAVLRKGGNIRVKDFAPKGLVPQWVTMGLAWDVPDGVGIDLDASVICLGKDLNVVDIVYFRQLVSKDRAITHGGDERDGEEQGDDEEIRLCLSRVSKSVTYIGFVINSYSGQELDDVEKASCHIFDPLTSTEIAKYALSQTKGLSRHTALLLGCLYRIGIGDWNFRVISEASQGKTAHDNVDELQRFLRRHPPQPPTIPPETNKVFTSMPARVPHKNSEVMVVPSSQLR